MNDEQLIRALRGLDRPVMPDPTFARSLLVDLRRQVQPKRDARLQLLLVATLLAAAALAAALAIGGGSFRPDHALSDATTPAPSSSPTAVPSLPDPSAPPYAIEIPEGVIPKSRPDQVERALGPGLSVSRLPDARIEFMRWSPAGDVPTMSGSILVERPVWLVYLVGSDGRRAETLVEDGTLNLAGGVHESEPVKSPPTPVASRVPIPTRDAAAPLQLIGADGRAISLTVIDIPESASLAEGSGPVVAGDIIWTHRFSVMTDEPARLLRFDTRTRELTSVALADGRWGHLRPGRDRMWLETDTEIRELDLVSGETVRSISPPDAGGLLGEDADGLWFRDVGGIVLVDPMTGDVIRRIASPEEGNHSYRGIWHMPAYGSLWEIDRGTGGVQRIDPKSGEITATIPIGADNSCGWMDPVPLTGITGSPDLIMACTGRVLIDPATNEVVRTREQDGTDVTVGGAWWWLPNPFDSEPWDAPGTLHRIDPATGADLDVLTLSHDGTVATSPVVAGGTVWFAAGERTAEDKGYAHNRALVGVPVDELVP